jgi:IS5 family transposase
VWPIFNLSDIASEDALYDVPVFREFRRIDLGRERAADATTLLNFRRLLGMHHLGAALFSKVGELLLANGMKLSGGTIVDATLIAAPLSAKRGGPAKLDRISVFLRDISTGF